MRAIGGDIRRLGALDRGRAADRREGAAGAARRSSATSPSTGRLPVVHVLRRRRRHPGRRRADDAARRRGRVRRLGHLQVRGPRAHRRGRRRGDHPLRGPRARRRRLARPRRADDRASAWIDDRGRRAACSRTAVGRPSSASSPSRATSRPTRRCSRASAPRRARSGRRRISTGSTALVIPGGESTTMTLGIEREGLAEPLRELVGAGTPVLGTCAGLIMLDRDHLGLLDVSRERNAFGRQVRSFEADLDLRGHRGRAAAAVFIRAPWVASRRRRSRCWPRSTAIRSRCGRATSSPWPSTPSSNGETRLHEWLLARVSRRRTEGAASEGPARRGARADPGAVLDEGRRRATSA